MWVLSELLCTQVTWLCVHIEIIQLRSNCSAMRSLHDKRLTFVGCLWSRVKVKLFANGLSSREACLSAMLVGLATGAVDACVFAQLGLELGK